MVVGNAGNAYTLPGLATRGRTRLVTVDAGGNLGSLPLFASSGGGGGLDTFEAIGQMNARIDGLSAFAVKARRESLQGVAAAMAMTAAPMPSAPGRTSWTANLATYKGQKGAGFSVAHRLDTAIPVALTAGYAYGGDDSHGVRVGVAGEF